MFFRKPLRLFVPWCLVALGPLRAQEALNPPVPLLRPTAAGAMSEGEAAVTLADAKRAQELGMTVPAAGLYRRLLARPGADQAELTLALTTVLLDGGEAAEVEKALAKLPEPHGAAWRVRAGLAALQLKQRDAAQAEWDAIKPEEVSPADLPWYLFLEAALYDTVAVRTGATLAKANELYLKAKEVAPTEMVRTRFQVAADRVRLQWGLPGDLEGTRKLYDAGAGTQKGYETARNFAVMLDAAGRKGDAVTFLQREVLLSLPPAERRWRDEFQLLLGLIGSRASDGIGRRALVQLLENGSDAERQRQALQLIAASSQTGVEREGWRSELDKLLGQRTPHPIRENLLLYRAQLALADKKYADAADRANDLLRQYPGSPLRAYAYDVLTSSAWEQQRYRGAADMARKERDELGEGAAAVRATLSALEAEAWFRAGLASGDANDFRTAADAYAAAWRERPSGDLLLQRMLAEIQAGALGAAQTLLDEAGREPATDFGTEYRWQAEWTLARAMQVQVPSQTVEALARVTKVLASEPPNTAGLPASFAELRARMKWLQARLAFEAGQPEQTLELTDKLVAEAGAIEPTLKGEILSTGALLRAEAQFELGRAATDPKVAAEREAAAREMLRNLRGGEFSASKAAISSYLVEADYFASRDKIDEAQKLLKELADKFPASEYAPHALFQAAGLAERLGQTAGYTEANGLLVELVKKYPDSDLVFAAQMKEGALKMTLNDYSGAQLVYQDLAAKFPQHKDVTRALLELARCINAQAADNPALLESAKTKFGDLRDRVDAPLEVRVEAGYNLGEVLVRRGNPEEAIVVWWHDVVGVLFPEPMKAAELGTTGAYWVARALVRAGDEDWKLGKLEDAKIMWRYVIERQLPYAAVAKAKLAEAGVTEAKP